MVHFTEVNPGESALRCLNAITDELVKLKYVDSSKLGLMGHSFGGYETLYFVTHSRRFAAALASAPISNLISGANALGANTPEVMREFIEKRDNLIRMRSTMWEKPIKHIMHSPVFEADKVTSPLLIMHNPKDSAVPFAQGMEFFLSMRRLGKPCWLLEYENGGHKVSSFEDLKDYTVRVDQFFDHYLKGEQAPLWLIEGQKYKDSKYTPGYELDTLGREPGPGINSPEEQKKIDEYGKIPFAEKIRPLLEAKKTK